MTDEASKEAYDVEENDSSRLEKVLSRIASRRSVASSIGPPPDGGFNAWFQVFLAHLVNFNTWGVVNSFGVFQTYYITALGHPSSDISWIGSVHIFLLFFIGTFSGRALDGGLFRVVFGAGVVFQAVGIFMTSLSTRYYQVFLAQGICIGIGSGLLFCPTVALVATYFSRHKALAMAIGASGTATGGVIYPIMVKELLPSVGFPWTMRAVGFVQLGVNAVAFAFMRTRVPPRTSGSIVDWSAFKDKTYTFLLVGMFFIFWALYFAFFYAGSFARDVIGFSYSDSINLIFVINAVGVPSRVIPALIADRYTGPLNLLIPVGLTTGVLMYAWSGVTNTAGDYAWTVVYGLIGNGIQSLWPTTLSTLTTDIKKTGTRMGMGFSVIAFACLTGPPLAGALIQEGNGSYLYAQMWAGSSLVLGSIFLVGARYARTGWKIKERV